VPVPGASPRRRRPLDARAREDQERRRERRAEAPGVLGVFTGKDVAGLGTMQMTLKRKRPDGSPMFAPPHRALAQERARYVGDPIALVVAETHAQAEDAADLVSRRLRAIAVGDVDGGRDRRRAVWDECQDNVCNLTKPATRARRTPASRRPRASSKRKYVITRVHAQFMEPRGSTGAYDPSEDRYTLYAGRAVSAPRGATRWPATSSDFRAQIRVIAGDIGGAFGTKGWQYPSTA